MKTCPTCGLINSDTAGSCDCGYDFGRSKKQMKARTRPEPMSAIKRWLLAFLASTVLVVLWFVLTYIGYLNWSPVTWIMNAIDENAGPLGVPIVLFVVWVALAVATMRAMRSESN